MSGWGFPETSEVEFGGSRRSEESGAACSRMTAQGDVAKDPEWEPWISAGSDSSLPCAKGGAEERGGGIVKENNNLRKTIPQSASLTAPRCLHCKLDAACGRFTQGSLYLNSIPQKHWWASSARPYGVQLRLKPPTLGEVAHRRCDGEGFVRVVLPPQSASLTAPPKWKPFIYPHKTYSKNKNPLR